MECGMRDMRYEEYEWHGMVIDSIVCGVAYEYGVTVGKVATY